MAPIVEPCDDYISFLENGITGPCMFTYTQQKIKEDGINLVRSSVLKVFASGIY
jgi:hypothetical protein